MFPNHWIVKREDKMMMMMMMMMVMAMVKVKVMVMMKRLENLMILLR